MFSAGAADAEGSSSAALERGNTTVGDEEEFLSMSSESGDTTMDTEEDEQVE